MGRLFLGARTMGKSVLRSLLGSRKPPPKTKKDTLAILKYEEHLIKKDFKKL